MYHITAGTALRGPKPFSTSFIILRAGSLHNQRAQHLGSHPTNETSSLDRSRSRCLREGRSPRGWEGVGTGRHGPPLLCLSDPGWENPRTVDWVAFITGFLWCDSLLWFLFHGWFFFHKLGWTTYYLSDPVPVVLVAQSCPTLRPHGL